MLKCQKEHYNEFMLGIDPPPFTDDVCAKLEHGQHNKLNAIATLVSIYMPAIFPSCAKYIEDGANFMHGQNKRRLLEVSTDGIINIADTLMIIHVYLI